MLKKRAIRKIFITTLTAFVLFVLYSIPNIVTNDNVLKTNLEVEYITNLGTNNIYLLDKNNYLVKTKILVNSNNKEEQIRLILDNLVKNNNSKYPNGLTGVIPEEVKILDINYDEGYVSIDFNNKINKMEQSAKEKMVEAIVYSIIDLGKIKGVVITSDKKVLDGFNKIIDKSIGINNKYDIKSRNNINKVVIYYIEKIDGNLYYVPVTRYLNDSRDKVEIIVEELSSSYIYEPNLMSFLSNNAKLLSYSEKENVMLLEFNNAIFEKNSKLVEEVKYSLAYSIFDNYDVKEVLIETSGNKKELISKKDLP